MADTTVRARSLAILYRDDMQPAHAELLESLADEVEELRRLRAITDAIRKERDALELETGRLRRELEEVRRELRALRGEVGEGVLWRRRAARLGGASGNVTREALLARVLRRALATVSPEGRGLFDGAHREGVEEREPGHGRGGRGDLQPVGSQLKGKVMGAKAVRKLHSKFRLYPECGHDSHEDTSEFHDGNEPIFVEEIGYTCAEPKIICYECHTDGGDVNENSEYGAYPCATLVALDAEEN